MALHAIRANKLRSSLTLLGIVVGIFSIISVMTAMDVLRTSIEEGITQLGANTFQIQRFGNEFNSTPEQRRKMRNRKKITYEQAVRVKDNATLAAAVGIEDWGFGRMIVWRGQKTNPNVMVCGENLEGIITNDWNIRVGRSFSNQDPVQPSPALRRRAHRRHLSGAGTSGTGRRGLPDAHPDRLPHGGGRPD